jgi:hypothetical protein
VRKCIAIFGRGCTDLAEILRIYEEEGVTRTFNCRHEVAMSHAARTEPPRWSQKPDAGVRHRLVDAPGHARVRACGVI